MKCKNCGKENADNAVFCMECGHDMREDMDFSKTQKMDRDFYYEDEKKSRKNSYYDDQDEETIVKNNSFKDDSMGTKQKGIIFGVVVIGLIVFSLLFNFGFGKYKMTKLENSAKANLEAKNYKEAREKYSELYEKSDDKKYLEAINKIDKNIEAKETLNKANQKFEARDYESSLALLMEVESDDEELSSKKDRLIEKNYSAIKAEINQLTSRNNFDGAINRLNSYITVDLENKEFKNMLEDINSQKSNSEKKAEEESEASKEKARADELEAQIIKLKNAEASNLIGTYQFVTSIRANVRSGPGFSYGVEFSLYKGDPVYVYDTRRADGRTWCNIGNGWISYRTLNGESK